MKIDIFPKGLTHGLGPNIAIFPTFFLGNIGWENVFYDILNDKTPFQAIKTRRSNGRRTDIFPKVLTHSFGPNMAIFPTFFCQAIQVRKMCFTIFWNDKMPFQAIKTRSQNSRKIDIFPKGLTHGFGANMAIFQTFFFKAIQVRKMSFTILWNDKSPFQAIKTRSSKSRKSDIFQKG